MQTTMVKPTGAAARIAAGVETATGRRSGGRNRVRVLDVQGVEVGAVSGRPNGGRLESGASPAAVREWDSSHHFGLDVRTDVPPRTPDVIGSLPLVRLENPGHSWAFVHLSHIDAIGALDTISECSYIVGSCAALEEDCDAPAAADAIEAATGRRLDWDRDMNTIYDELFEWDYAYDNFRAAFRHPGRERVLAPYSAAAASRIAMRWRPPKGGRKQ